MMLQSAGGYLTHRWIRKNSVEQKSIGAGIETLQYAKLYFIDLKTNEFLWLKIFVVVIHSRLIHDFSDYLRADVTFDL